MITPSSPLLRMRWPSITPNSIGVHFLFAAFFVMVGIGEPFADQPLGRVPPLAQALRSSTDKLKEVDSNGKLATVESDETLLLDFVEQQQPKLLKLLEFMKRKQPVQYDQALKELSKSKQRLSNLEKRDVELYKIELQLWQIRSQLRMLVAEIAVAESASQDKLHKRLAELVTREVDLDVARLQLEQSHAEQRAEQLKKQLHERSEDREATISKALKTWENRVSRQSPRSKSTKPKE